MEYSEEVARFTYRGMTDRVVMGRERRTEEWWAFYLREGQELENAQATLHGKERCEVLEQTRRFLIGHGQCLWSNLVEARDGKY